MKIITDDGRDITNAEWRRVPGFKRYKITDAGDLMNIESGKLKKETGSERTGYHYCVFSDDGRKTSRNYVSLLRLAWPEMFEEKALELKPLKEPRPYLRKDGWKDIPGFPLHQCHIEGAVRTKKQRHAMKTKINSLNGEEYVFIQSGQGLWPVSINDLIAMTFNETDEQEYRAA